ncbi:hypothetical protein [Deinococcus ruber]|uniref:Uncharacterized protein n=1 Tax=Deinococcus ruber TaxID=1848197 RepID=A0A918FDR7_9DEIO|nr:hypothetical protein [Deinococcus ruber]GGR25383.1 hypothetical protein GCM10008957_41270 [Deinococcus ruber]
MTPDAPTPSTSLAAEEQRAAELREAQFTRKLVLAVLSTLQHKGILKAAEVDALLLAARRAADAASPAVTAATAAATPPSVQPPMPAAPTPLQTTEVRAKTGVPMKVRAEPARPIALHTQPPAPVPTEQPVPQVAEPAEQPQPVAAALPDEAEPAAVSAERRETGDVRRLYKGGKSSKDDTASKAPPVFDIQID